MPYVPSEKTPNPSGIVKDGKAQDRILIVCLCLFDNLKSLRD